MAKKTDNTIGKRKKNLTEKIESLKNDIADSKKNIGYLKLLLAEKERLLAQAKHDSLVIYYNNLIKKVVRYCDHSQQHIFDCYSGYKRVVVLENSLTALKVEVQYFIKDSKKIYSKEYLFDKETSGFLSELVLRRADDSFNSLKKNFKGCQSVKKNLLKTVL